MRKTVLPILFVLASYLAAAQIGQTQHADTTAQEILKVTISPSRSSVTRDGSYGVFADLENLSSEVVTIKAAQTKLIIQPEVTQPYACVESVSAIFPMSSQPDGTDPKKAEVRIQPKEHYTVFWGLVDHDQPENCRHPRLRQLADYLGFVPGDYTFTVQGILYIQPNGAPEPVSHTYRETVTLHVGISQVGTAIAAFFGALLAYFVVSLQPGQDLGRWKTAPATGQSEQFKSFAAVVRNAVSAGLLGSTVTIVASRLSDTQFPIKVSVNDFWGALTIGFVSYFIGAKFIATIAAKFLASIGGSAAPPAPNPAPPTPSPAPPTPSPAPPTPAATQTSAATITPATTATPPPSTTTGSVRSALGTEPNASHPTPPSSAITPPGQSEKTTDVIGTIWSMIRAIFSTKKKSDSTFSA